MLRTSSKFFFICCLSLSVTASGCDQVKTIMEYFQKPEDKPALFQAKTAQGGQSAQDKAQGPLPADAIVRIGSWTLTKQEFTERIAALKEAVPDFDPTDPEARKAVLEELVNQQVLVADAEKQGIAEKKEVIAAMEEFRRTVLVREVAKSIIGGIEATDEDAKVFYEANKDKIVTAEEWRVRDIMVKTQEEAQAARQKIIAGASFADTAKEVSLGANAAQGGDRGFIADVPFPQMATALLPLDVGQVSEPFQGPDGYYVVTVEEKRGGELIPFDQVKDEIKANATMLKQRQALVEHIEKIKKDMSIEKNEALLAQ